MQKRMKPRQTLPVACFILFAWACGPYQALARINLPTCWPNDQEYCVVRNDQGTWCYSVSKGLTTAYPLTNCSTTSDGASGFTLAMRAHLQSHLSVAYYSGDNKLLGGVDWPVPAVPGVTTMCMSGLGRDGFYRTSCTNAAADNTIGSGGSPPFCSVNFAQVNVQDGCYPPPATAGAISPNGTTPTTVDTPSTTHIVATSRGYPNAAGLETPPLGSTVSLADTTVILGILGIIVYHFYLL